MASKPKPSAVVFAKDVQRLARFYREVVGSIAQARARASEQGGSVGPKGTEWQARGFTACDGFDPEGNVFQLRKLAP